MYVRASFAILLTVMPGLAVAQDFGATRNINGFQPVVIQDATPIDPGWQADSSVAARDDGAAEAVVVRPTLRYGLDRAQLSLGTTVSVVGDQGIFGGVDLSGMYLLVREEGWVPAVSVMGILGSPSDQTDGAVGAAVLATETIERTRIHANGSYRVTFDAPDEWVVGAAVDYVFGERILAIADAYVQEIEDEVGPGADLGAQYRFGEAFLLQASVGLLELNDEAVPRFLVGFTSHM